MTIVLNLPPEIEAKLREQSARTGRVPEELALRALEEQLVSDEQPAAAISAEEWVADICAWAKGHRHLPHDADDSRESFYAGRGE
jgi:hypothetical protein